jgi:hypothetical protein
MSQTAVEQVIGRMVTDPEFRNLVFSNPDQALAEYDLTMDERQAILALESKHVEDFAGKLDKRITKAKFEI